MRTLGVLGCLSAWGVWFASTATAAEPAADAAEVKYFETHVRPVLAQQCVRCHGAEKQRGGLRLDTLAGMLAGGDSGPAIVPGKPEESMLVEAINYESYEMPPDGQLEENEIAVLTEWIRAGAKWPAADVEIREALPKGLAITEEDRSYWAFQPVRRPEVPVMAGDGWSQNEVDRFIYRGLEKAGLSPAPPADRRDLIRRAYFDLLGLPPTSEEIDAFVSDPSPNAYAELIDRLLESPRYGERWGRHWLDLARYAESDGFRADGYRPHAWRYRDYVIRSFNDDKPYDQFVMEQLAGDELAPHDADALVATGFLRHYLYEYNQRDARTQWQDILNNITDVTGEVFLGMGVGCARCHDHKFDPILQEDYFRLQSFFAAVLPRDDVPAASAEERAEYERQLAEWEAVTVDIRRQIEEIERPYMERAAKKAIIKFPPDIQAIMAKPEAERSSLEIQLADLVNRQVWFEEARVSYKEEDKKRLEELRKQLAQHEAMKPQPLPPAFTVSDTGPQADPTYIPGDSEARAIPPGFFTVLHTAPAEIEAIPTAPRSTGRRATLAKWIASPDNPLSTRVIVNRVWQYHFGKGLVATSSDFGHLGEKPSHPELLDWLTTWFVDHGWSFKQLHRLVMLSATYQQSAAHPDAERAAMIDPTNRLRWRSDVHRLAAEQIRDAMLAVSGELDLRMGGAGVAGSVPRRSIYTKVIRNRPDPFLKAFDVADGFNSVAERSVTTTSTQALLMINGEWTLGRATSLAKRIAQSHSERPAQVIAAYRAAFGREPAEDELAEAVSFITQQEEEQKANQRPLQPIPDKIAGSHGTAAALKEGSRQPNLVVADASSLPAKDFTVEAVIQLESLYPDSTVRTIVSQWNSNNSQPGWALGVTSTKSAYQPRNLILQLVGNAGYEVIASDLRPELNKPYYVAVSVRIGEKGESGVTFYLRDLSRPDAELQTAHVPHKVTGNYRSNVNLVIGGRHGQGRQNWDGLIDEVRISSAALPAEQLLIHGGTPDSVAGFWRFEQPDHFYADASPHANDIVQGAVATAGTTNSETAALVDLCHVLLNSNEFLYVD